MYGGRARAAITRQAPVMLALSQPDMIGRLVEHRPFASQGPL